MVEIWNTWTERVMDVESVNTFKQCLKINLNAYLKSCDLLESGMKLGRAFKLTWTQWIKCVIKVYMTLIKKADFINSQLHYLPQ